jgi:hypothetical protein
MAMYLSVVPVFTFMLLGRWNSDAFLRYIRKQVKELSSGTSNMMIKTENFFTIQFASQDVPRVSNHSLNYALRNLIGPCYEETIHPLVGVFHQFISKSHSFTVCSFLYYIIILIQFDLILAFVLIKYFIVK